MKTERTEIVPVAVAPKRSAMAILDDVTKSGASVEIIEAIAKLYREERDDARRMAFDASMAQAQSEMRRVAPDRDKIGRAHV